VLGLDILLIFYLGMLSLLGKMSPMSFLRNIREAQLLAFSTSSSAAVMPLSMETAEKKLSVEPSIARFIIPLGATINMDGTALYQVTAAVFLTQVFRGAPRHLGPDCTCGHCGWRLNWDAQHAGCRHSRAGVHPSENRRATVWNWSDHRRGSRLGHEPNNHQRDGRLDGMHGNESLA
jgi:hypothetical protein